MSVITIILYTALCHLSCASRNRQSNGPTQTTCDASICAYGDDNITVSVSHDDGSKWWTQIAESSEWWVRVETTLNNIMAPTVLQFKVDDFQHTGGFIATVELTCHSSIGVTHRSFYTDQGNTMFDVYSLSGNDVMNQFSTRTQTDGVGCLNSDAVWMWNGVDSDNIIFELDLFADSSHSNDPCSGVTCRGTQVCMDGVCKSESHTAPGDSSGRGGGRSSSDSGSKSSRGSSGGGGRSGGRGGILEEQDVIEEKLEEEGLETIEDQDAADDNQDQQEAVEENESVDEGMAFNGALTAVTERGFSLQNATINVSTLVALSVMAMAVMIGRSCFWKVYGQKKVAAAGSTVHYGTVNTV